MIERGMDCKRDTLRREEFLESGSERNRRGFDCFHIDFANNNCFKSRLVDKEKKKDPFSGVHSMGKDDFLVVLDIRECTVEIIGFPCKNLGWVDMSFLIGDRVITFYQCVEIVNIVFVFTESRNRKK